MKIGINQWSLPIGEKPIKEVLKYACDLGLNNVELCITPIDPADYEVTVHKDELFDLFSEVAQSVNAQRYMINLNPSEAELKDLRELLVGIGMNVVSVTTLDLFRYTLTSNNTEVRDTAEMIVKKMIDICSYFEGDTVLIEPGVVTSDLSYVDAYNNCKSSITKLAGYAEKKNVILALENVWGKFLMSPIEFRNFIDEINNDYVKVYFDVANVLEFGHPQDWIRILGSRIVSIHFKDFKLGLGLNGFCNPYEGDVKWREVKRALKDIKYNGNIVAETMIPEFWPFKFMDEMAEKLKYFAEK